ncbi:nucleotide exchange factor GrpE [Amycolatopsis rhizosphaerae]|uniref:Nucleotide exchange factor GrpE n=1 Tax=Amycolatopsis rhizosphaerae TaxID=2053003 RepID=A0A558AIX8_9PSEU|nr:nucleotide exchange factor GrpE [Amycolatopsis rhizosphaerae]TVT24199.1 nucleotide exchange factor GrpE [Amycolatopsis rhizosphaerae]
MSRVPSWFRREPEAGADDPTGEIPGASLAKLIEEADGTAAAADASKSDVSSGVVTSELERALSDRQALIQLCLYALDRARSGGVVERLEQGLAGIGVTAVRPDGQRFDPAVHEAGGAVATDDPALDGLVAETEVVGFNDHDRLLRPPIVTVYTKR